MKSKIEFKNKNTCKLKMNKLQHNKNTNFEKVLAFNKAFGVTTHDKPQLNILENEKELIKYRLSLVTEEYKELVDAVENKDIVETIDGLADLLFVTYGFFSSIGIDADKAYDIVSESNMSKICKTEEEAQKTVELYLKETPQRYDSPTYRRADDNKNWVVFNQSTKKILKSYLYTPANFETIMK